MLNQLTGLRNFFETGATRPADFRLNRMKALKKSIEANEQAIYDALYHDLRKSKEECWITENGMVLSELKLAINQLKYWMEPERTGTNLLNFPSACRIEKEPLGVVLIISPWNYPFQLLFNPLVGAIAAGNCVVLKPSEHAPATAEVVKKIIGEVFSQDHVLVAEGNGAVVVPYVMKHFVFDHVFYTGSTAVGKIIYKLAAENLVPVTLELGGKSPCIVEDDANIEVAARRIAVTKFNNAGQMCVAPDYVLVHESKKKQLIDALKKSIVQFFSGDASKSYNYGKIINEQQFNRLHTFLSSGKIVAGGRSNKQELYIEPTILDDVLPGDAIMQEEIFGPILPVLSFRQQEQAMQVVQMHKNPLAFYVFTSSIKKEKDWLTKVAFGGGCVNNCSLHLTNPALPFGGRGNSGIGKYHGKFSFDTFSHSKAVMKTPTWFDPSVKYPPFNGRLRLFKLFVR